jgi:hypothetical protein
MNWQLLKTEVDNYPLLTSEALADQLNTANIEAVQNIQVADIKQYLVVTGKILAIKASLEPAALLTVEALDSFDKFVMIEPSNVAALNNQMDGLIAVNSEPKLFTIDDKNYILSLGVTVISRANQLGLGVVTPGDIEYVRGLA